jgi:hypothetical protein
MNATAHPVAPEELMAYLDAELSPERGQSVSAHVENCANCQAFISSLRSTSHHLDSWTIAPAPLNPRFENQLTVAAADASSKSFAEGGPKLRFFPKERWKLVTACSALGVLVLVLIGMTGGQYRMSLPKARLAAERQVAEQEPSTDELKPPALTFPQQFDSGRFLEKSKSDLHVSGGRPMDDKARSSGASVPFAEPMIARTVSLSIISKDFDAARASLDAILARHHGYAANLNANTPQGAARSIQASLRIPAPQLAATIAELKSLGRVENENQNGDEVTQQHADLVARLKNSRETEQRLQSILLQRTGKISDVLEVEQEIARVRGEIEQMQAEQQTLEHRVDFATIDLKLSEEYKAKLDSPAPAISTLIHNALVNGLRTAADSVLSLVLFLSESGPVLLLWLAILALPARQLWRRYRRAVAVI